MSHIALSVVYTCVRASFIEVCAVLIDLLAISNIQYTLYTINIYASCVYILFSDASEVIIVIHHRSGEIQYLDKS